MVNTIVGRPAPVATQYVGRRIWSRKTKGERPKCGKVTTTSACQMEGCRGVRLHVVWKDGKKTRPCSRGCTERDNGDLEIL